PSVRYRWKGGKRIALPKPCWDKGLGKIVSQPLGPPPTQREKRTRGRGQRPRRTGAPERPGAGANASLRQPAERLRATDTCPIAHRAASRSAAPECATMPHSQNG